MKLIGNEQTLDILSFVINDNIGVIQTDIAHDTLAMMELLVNSHPLVYCDEETVIGTVDGDYTFDTIEERGQIRTYFLKIPDSHVELPKSELDKLNEQITNIELALCEIYENSEV